MRERMDALNKNIERKRFKEKRQGIQKNKNSEILYENKQTTKDRFGSASTSSNDRWID